MKKIFSSVLFLGLAFGINSVIFAQDNNSQNQTPNAQQKMNRKERARKMRGGKHEGLGALNLTDAQKQQIKNIRQSSRTSGAGRDEIRQQILAVLTPEQRQQWEQMRQERRSGKGDRARRENRGENRKSGNGESRGGRFQGLNLTDAQKEQLRQLRTNNSNDSAFQELRQLRQAKRNGSLTPEQENRLKTLRQQAKANGEKRRDQILSILTPEQRQQFEQNKDQRRERRGKRTENR